MISRFEHFSTSISCISRYIQRIERMEMEQYGLKGPHAQCLLAMSRYPEGITAAQLTTISDKDKAAISRAVSELIKGGLVERRNNKENAYRAPLYLTEKGQAAAAEVDRLARLAVEQAGKGLTEEHRQLFYSALDLIATNLARISREGIDEA